jgi:hypothetical protein
MTLLTGTGVVPLAKRRIIDVLRGDAGTDRIPCLAESR